MKKLLLLAAVCGFALNGFSQGKTWSKVIDIGLMGQVRSSWLVNQNVNDAAGEMDVVASWASGGGLRVQYFGAGSFGAGFEVNYATLTQKYDGNVANATYNSSNKLTHIDIPVYGRVGSSEGGYFELGCQFSLLQKAVYETDNALQQSFAANPETSFKDSYIAPFLGFGGAINLYQNQIMISMGLRLAYGVTDVAGMDGLGQDLTEGNTTTYNNPFNPLGYSEYKSTNPVYAAFLLGIVYSIPLE